ncbi:MAG: aldehyde dehydrogenase family protein [Peptoniphilaceae bacterium]|nr:aldehyde dehydrogenase family protein [Peptoniphilaceae bacterium]MDY6019134.1 aldehyde dehydrogenase family protein [Anaerococcus sp.]
MTDIKTIVKDQREFFLTGQSRNENFRLRNLRALKEGLDIYKDEIIKALNKDLNKSSFESHMSELMLVYEEIRFAEKNLLEWMKPQRAITPMAALPGKSYTVYEPLGVNLIISPWNYPVMLSLDPLVGAIAAGNTSILKLSSKSENTTKVLRKMINNTFPENYIYAIDNEETSKEELLEEKFDHIFFTGSARVGKTIMEKASRNLSKLTLELGGKSPCIVDESANIELAAKRIMWGKLLNAGQTCIAPDYIIAHKAIKDKLMLELKSFAIEFFGANPIENPDYPKIINKNALERLQGLLVGENIYFGGRVDKDLQKIEPTIVDKLSFDNKLMKEEIFGPILPVLEYEDIFALINKLKTLEKPLALYMFSEDRAHIDRIMYDLSYGNGCVNDTIMQIASTYLEFGGVGNSGMGGYHGKYGFINFSNRKSIMDRPTHIDINLRYPPYSKGQTALVKLLEK